MITELGVSDALRGKDLGKQLMNKAKEIAEMQKRRAVILETQSCNTNAIGFYLHEGFELIGFYTCCYTNNDIGRQEVRINLGYFFTEKDGEYRMQQINIFPDSKGRLFLRPIDPSFLNLFSVETASFFPPSSASSIMKIILSHIYTFGALYSFISYVIIYILIFHSLLYRREGFHGCN